jgi:hypothetical protein
MDELRPELRHNAGKPHIEQKTSSEAKLKATSFPSVGLILQYVETLGV